MAGIANELSVGHGLSLWTVTAFLYGVGDEDGRAKSDKEQA